MYLAVALLLFSICSAQQHTTDNLLLAGKTTKFKATILNTNFSVPLARFNFTNNQNDRKGNILLFNSVGAGFGISSGELRETREGDGDIINQEFTNTFGVHAGFIFSAAVGDDTKNVFAPTLNLSLLDFQIGVGYELGTLAPGQKPVFLSLSYAIPLYKLRREGFYIWLRGKEIEPAGSNMLAQ